MSEYTYNEKEIRLRIAKKLNPRLDNSDTPETNKAAYEATTRTVGKWIVPIAKAQKIERERDLAKDHLTALLAFVLEDFQPGLTSRGYRKAVENACFLLGISLEN